MFAHSLLQAQFALLVPPSSLFLPDESFEELHEVLLNRIFLDAHLNEYPPSKEYQLTFWKWALKHLETLAKYKAWYKPRTLMQYELTVSCVKDVEIDSRLYENLIYLMTSSSCVSLCCALPTAYIVIPRSNISRTPQPPRPSYVTYYLPQPNDAGTSLQLKTATLLESRTMIEQGTVSCVLSNLIIICTYSTTQTGLKTWPAAMALAEYLLKLPGLFSNKIR